jgi:hypothetical protein
MFARLVGLISIQKDPWDMKSERRHELQHNELADWLIKTGRRIKPYQNIMYVAVMAALVLIVACVWWLRASAAQTTKAWGDFNAAMSGRDMDSRTDGLTKVMDTYPGTNVSYVAAVVLGDSRLAQGCTERFNNRAMAQNELNSAITTYEKVLRECQTPALRERATFGMARAKEGQCDLQAARKLYEEVVEKWPKGTYTSAATEHLAQLAQPETQQMLQDLRDPNFGSKPAVSKEKDSETKELPPSFETPEEGSVVEPKAKSEPKAGETKPEKGADTKK